MGERKKEDRREKGVRGMGDRRAKNDWSSIGSSLVVHWSMIGIYWGFWHGICAEMSEKYSDWISSVKILLFFELCKSLGDFFEKKENSYEAEERKWEG